MKVFRAMNLEIHCCNSMNEFVAALNQAISTGSRTFALRAPAMVREVTESYEKSGICGFFDVTQKSYYLCIDPKRATKTAYEEMADKVLDAYAKLTVTTKPAPRFAGHAPALLPHTNMELLAEVGNQIFDTENGVSDGKESAF